MDPLLMTIAFVVSVVFTLYSQWDAIMGRDKGSKEGYKANKQVNGSELLDKHTQEFAKEVIKVGENVYCAIGFGLANSIMIEGEDGVVIIDTLESCEVAREVKAEFEKITTKPIRAIILTHFHADHAYGTAEFVAGREGEIDIYAHDTFSAYYSQAVNIRSPITYRRAMRQFGTLLERTVSHKNSGIGIRLNFEVGSTVSYTYPTKTFSDRLSVSVAGLDLELIHAPGETNDQIIVWYPKHKILFPADNIYRAFPNLYAIRGTMHRDTLKWAAAIDTMRSLAPETLVPQHTRPVYGEDVIVELLTDYRDAIQFVHDQTVRYMNKGLTGREIAEKVVLPPHLAKNPHLVEYYGTVEWSVRAVYAGYIGWFSGRPADLHPLPVSTEARLLVELGGGVEAVTGKAAKAVEEGKYQWGLQLADALMDSGNTGLNVKEIRGKCLRQLAMREVSAPGRNWYLTCDAEMGSLKIVPNGGQTNQRIQAASMADIFLMLTVRLDADKASQVVYTAVFRFTDTEETLVVLIRRGVCEILQEVPSSQDLLVETTSSVWRDIVGKQRQALAASLTGELYVTPGVRHLATFFGYFEIE